MIADEESYHRVIDYVLEAQDYVLEAQDQRQWQARENLSGAALAAGISGRGKNWQRCIHCQETNKANRDPTPVTTAEFVRLAVSHLLEAGWYRECPCC